MLIRDNNVCWFRPIQVHSSSEIRHKIQNHPRQGYIYYLGDAYTRTGKALLAQTPYLRVANNISCPIYIRDLDSFICTGTHVKVQVYCDSHDRVTYTITKGMLLHPTVYCSIKSHDNSISIDKTKVFRSADTEIKVDNNLINTLFS